MAQRTLTDLEKRIIDFAAGLNGRKVTDAGVNAAFVAEFGWRPVTFHQRLNALLSDPAAERERPLEVRALRRVRDNRRMARLAAFPSRKRGVSVESSASRAS